VTLVEDFAVVFSWNCDVVTGGAQEGAAGFDLSA
jgi:hypothetical protein